MINIFEVNETNKMIEKENLDVRTITLGISLLDLSLIHIFLRAQPGSEYFQEGSGAVY